MGQPQAGQRPSQDFLAVFESLPGAFAVLDPDLRIIAVSDAYLEVTMTTRAGILGRALFEVFPDDPDAPQRDTFAAVRASFDRVRRDLVAEPVAVQRFPIRRPKAEGGGFEERYWSWVSVPVLGPGGGLACIIVRSEDVTDYVRLRQQETENEQLTEQLRLRTRQMEAEILARSREVQDANQALHDANQALRAASEAKNQFMSRVSHELRTPLNAIMGFGELLSLGEVTAEHHEWVSMMLKAARHLLVLLDEVVDISSIETRGLSLSMEAVPVAGLITDALELVQPLAMSRGVHLDPAPPLASRCYVHADHQRLRQVLLNLLSNAIKYNHPAGTVTITASQQPASQQPGDRLRIAVADTGRGIAADDLDRLFTPFERLDAAQAGIEGTGLGLALSRQLVSAMGGTSGVQSTLGEGSVFWIELPAAEPIAVAQVAIARDPVAVPRTYAAPKTVLYVEDMVENLRLVEQILKQRPSTTVIPAMLGGVALDLARQHHPDLILLDLHLPDIPGEEVLRRLQADPATRTIPVVVLSADATPHQIDRLLAAGAASYLTKPLSVRAFLQAADQVLGEQSPAPETRARTGRSQSPRASDGA
jgi:signal transduction histidine kinase/ActR/RegA family two-component response regulator